MGGGTVILRGCSTAGPERPPCAGKRAPRARRVAGSALPGDRRCPCGVTVPRAVREVVPQVRAVHAHALPVSQHAHVIPVDLVRAGARVRVRAGARVRVRAGARVRVRAGARVRVRARARIRVRARARAMVRVRAGVRVRARIRLRVIAVQLLQDGVLPSWGLGLGSGLGLGFPADLRIAEARPSVRFGLFDEDFPRARARRLGRKEPGESGVLGGSGLKRGLAGQ